MKLRQIKIDLKFIPEFNGNKDLPLNDQLVIHFNRIPGTSEKSRYKTFSFHSSGSVQLVNEDNLLISTFVAKVENLEIEDGSKIKNGNDLATASCPALTDLFTEIRSYLFPDDEDLSEGESTA